MNSLSDKVVVVTGASSGIGLACVYAFYEQGCKVVAAARNIELITKVAEELNNGKSIRHVLPIYTDVSVEGDCMNLIEKSIQEFGTIDILINNAGISMRASFTEVNLAVLKKLMDVNFWGTVYCTKYALPEILKNNGSIVCVSSVAGINGMPGRSGYSASKYAMLGFTDTIRIEYLEKKLHVMEVIPGFVATNIRFSALTADGSCQGESPRRELKMMSAEEVATRIIKGIKKKKRRLTTSYEGKFTPIVKLFFPGLVDRLYLKSFKKEPNSPI